MNLLYSGTDLRHLRILLVEDDEDDYVFIRDLLGDLDLHGLELEWISSYDEALEAARDRRHDLYLLDYRLGARTGVELLEEADLGRAAAPAIMLTGVDDRRTDERALSAGAKDFLTKGEIDAHVLERSIRYSVEGKRTENLQRFLAQATQLFNASLEYSTTVGTAARVVVPELADWSCLYVPEGEERYRAVELVHPDPDRDAAARRLGELTLARGASPPVNRAMEERRPIVLPRVDEENLEAWFGDPEHRVLVESLGANSATVIPLQGRTGVLGALVLVLSNDRRRYREEDLPFFQDLGHRVTLALENARLFETVREATRVRDELMSMVSHDLGNPLAAVSIAAGRIEHHLEDPDREQIARFTEMIRSAAGSMERLLEDLLEVGRLETGHFGLRRTGWEPREMLDRIEERFAPRAESQDIDLEVERDRLLPDVLVDRERILQVLSNLLNNALKFTPPGGAVRVTTHPEDGHLRIAVSDTGSGMDEEEMEHLFDRFWQSRRHHRAGAGLGLTISREIVQAHGGEIWAESEPGAGSTFHFTLPVAEERDLEEGVGVTASDDSVGG